MCRKEANALMLALSVWALALVGSAGLLAPSGHAWAAGPADIVLDGDLSEWTPADRLDENPGHGVPGYEVYGRYEGNTFLIAIKTDGPVIGPYTTLWLNTDQDPATGHRIWDWAGGAEYNVNFYTDSLPYLYTGAAGEFYETGPLEHAYGPGGTVVELAVPESLLDLGGSPRNIDLLIDVDDAVFLPPDYALRYTISTVPPPSIAIDGDLGDWSQLDRLDAAPTQGTPGYEVYGRYEGGTLLIAIETDGTVIGPYTTIWLNTDQEPTTGHRIWGWAGGAEYNVNFYTDSQPYLYTGAAGAFYETGPLEYAYGPGGTAVELAIPESLLGLGDPPRDVDVLIDVNDAVFLPPDYALQYTIRTEPLPQRTDFGKRVGIVYSATTAARFYDARAYCQLFQSMQHQAMMAGIPFDLLTEDELTDAAALANYDALILPYLASVPVALLPAITDTLFDAVYRYRIGIITAGDLLTLDENGLPLPGDPYERQKLLLGLQRLAGSGPVDFDVRAAGVEHPVMRGYEDAELIRTYEQAWFGSYGPAPGQTATVLADQGVGGVVHNAVVATETGGRNVHFGTVDLMGHSKIAWSALQWVVYGDKTPVGLKIGRDESLFVARNDMDQSQFAEEIPLVEEPLSDLIADWKSAYNFVGSFYINIGNDPDDGAYTDWTVSAPLYQDYMTLGNEIGTHSYTHPDWIDPLTPEELEFEFNQSKIEIEAELGMTVAGGAVPGNAESLEKDDQIGQWLPYLSGTYSNVGSGYPGAFGYLRPDSSMIYFNLNMLPDFTLIEFLGMSAAQAELEWQEQYADLTSHASLPIIHWLWHDYGPTIGTPVDGYSVEMYANTLEQAYRDGTEFATAADVHARIKDFMRSRLEVADSGGITATVTGTNVGKFSLSVDTDQVIQSVADWYAYNERAILLPRGGGEFTISLGDSQVEATRIVSLPMRAELISATGDGTDLAFVLEGEGRVVVRQNVPPGANLFAQGAADTALSGEHLAIDLEPIGLHSVSLVLNLGPMADAGPDQAVGCSVPGTATVSLDASGSWDADDDPLRYTWNGPFGTINTEDAVTDAAIPFGSHEIVLTVDDRRGGVDSDSLWISFPEVSEVCDDGVDNDCDDLVDCRDAGCRSHASCVLITADFDDGPDGFGYRDDTFRNTDEPYYSDGKWRASESGGVLQVTLGGINGADITGMSGGWERPFGLSGPAEVELSFRYKLTQTHAYEPDEHSQVLVSLDGILYGRTPNDYVDQLAGGGTTGWQLFRVNLGTLVAGEHTLVLGGYNNKKTYRNEKTTILIEDVRAERAIGDCGLDVDDDGIADCEDGCLDVDGDGYGETGGGANTCLGTDCDDTNADVNPAAADVCNGTDDDCDIAIDENFAPQSTSCGLGACAAAGFTSCVEGVALDTCQPGDPGFEVCGDGIDNDCDDLVDCLDTSCQSHASCVLIGADFDDGPDGFGYRDDTFRDTDEPYYADGDWRVSGSGGVLRVTLGGINGADIEGMSGGWARHFSLSEATGVELSFRYKLTQAYSYAPDERSQVLISLDGILYGRAPNDYVAQLAGGGKTGWRPFQINLGTLEAGEHTLVIGGYNNKKTQYSEVTTILIDDVAVTEE